MKSPIKSYSIGEGRGLARCSATTVLRILHSLSTKQMEHLCLIAEVGNTSSTLLPMEKQAVEEREGHAQNRRLKQRREPCSPKGIKEEKVRYRETVGVGKDGRRG